MRHWDEIHKDSKEGFDLVLSVAWEDIPLNDLFEDDEAQELAIQIDKGDLVYFIARVEGYKKGIRLSDTYLGGNIYASYSDFIGSWEHESITDEALAEAKQRLKELTE